VRPGRFHALDVELDRVLGRVVVTLDGQEARHLATALHPVVRDRIWLGRGARGKNAPDLGRFSGGIVSESMEWALPPGRPLPDLTAEPTVLADEHEPPPAAEAGRQWASAAREGVFVFDGARWRFVARYFLDRVSVTRTVALAGAGDAGRPILSSGGPEAADVLEVRSSAGGQVVVAYRRWPDGPSLGGPALPVSGSSAVVAVLLDRPEGRVRVTLDGRTALEARADLLPLEKSRIVVGRFPAAGRQP
jgi:hypothetical protein